MNPNDNDHRRSITLYGHCENLHASRMEARYGEGAHIQQDNRFTAQEPRIDVQALIKLRASSGPSPRPQAKPGSARPRCGT